MGFGRRSQDTASERTYTVIMTTTKSAWSLVLIPCALMLCSFTYFVLSDDNQFPDELPNLFLDDGSTVTLAPELESELYVSTTDFTNPDLFLADASDDACTTGSSQVFNKNRKRAHEECKPQSSTEGSPIKLPPFLQFNTDSQESQLQFNTDPLKPQEPNQFLQPDPNDLSLPYPFEHPPDNYKICPKLNDGRLYAVCDSGISTDNKYEEL